MENIKDFLSIVSDYAGIASFVTLIYLIGVWKGKVDSTLTNITRLMNQYPPQEATLMVKTLWDIYIVDALHHRPDLAEHGSAFKLKKDGDECIPAYLKAKLDAIPVFHNGARREDIASGYMVVKHIGLDLIGEMAREKELSVQEAIAIMSTYLDNTPLSA